ncbi:HEXXH motif domain-containing protein [Nocardia sp. CWNU-33]|uniref:HEXXH motif domain-containing protein n=1 Tax=Nocardia sp. CWNU-33 TaxID=3392117 RepID=UPI00398F38F6
MSTTQSGVDHAIADLGSGHGGVRSVATLLDGTITARMILLRTLIAETTARRPEIADRAGLSAAYRSLADLQGTHPAEVVALLSYPLTGQWLADVLPRLDAESDAASTPLWADCGYLGWLAAAGALACLPEGSMTLVVRHGAVMLPGIGLARLGSTEDCGQCELYWCSGILRFTNGTDTVVVASLDDESHPGWLPMRRVRGAGDEQEVFLDDLDPFRSLSDTQPAPPRLTASESEQWQQDFAGAWDLLHRDFDRYLAPMRRCLQTLVPLNVGPLAASTSHTAAPGCVYTTAPADPCQLALTLIHEIQHTKFNLLTDHVIMFEPDPTYRYYAPWRDDPRPIFGLLHGIYAFFGVTDFWRIHRNAECHRSLEAHVDFALWRNQVKGAMAQAMGSGLLTPSGEEFLRTLAAGMRAWSEEVVPGAAAHAAAEVSLAHRTFWQVRNLRVENIGELAAGWAARAARLDVLPSAVLISQQSVSAEDRSLHLAVQLKLADYDAAVAVSTAQQPDGDHAYLAGDLAEAVARYTKQLRSEPLRPQLWAGLALALPKLYPDNDFSILNSRAEVAATLYGEIGSDTDAAELVQLLHWLSHEPTVYG